MVVNKNTSRLVGKEDFIRLAILLTIALVIGTYLIATTVMIAKDGVFYIKRAQQFESDPIEVIKKHPPGYPFLIFIAHKSISLFRGSVSIQTWIYSAQSVTLLCRLLAIIPLYFIGKLLIGSRHSFWGLLILIMLPYPAEFGSDVLRGWPHILFLSTGLLFLIWGSRFAKWWMFAIAGLAAGLGHTIRPECAQIVIYGILWLLISLFLPKLNISRLKAICLTLILLMGFAIPTAPYIKVRGKVLPSKAKQLFSCNSQERPIGLERRGFDNTVAVYTVSGTPADILKAFGRLAQEIADNLVYFFVLPLVVGLYFRFRRLRKILLTERFFIFALIVLYVVMMVLLHIKYSYISRRHCMPIIVFTAFYIPVGLQTIARWLSKRIFKSSSVTYRDRKRWFFILMAIGLSICMAKFVRITPLRWEKRGYKEAAEWLRGNTAPVDIIAVPDTRIAFYAERKGLIYGKEVPKRAKYVVEILGDGDKETSLNNSARQKYSVWVDKKKRIVIYEEL
ncbi:MAG: glycosyltransferase family protein [Planctomycetota bacterium]|jgi:hypothetical protein